MTAPAVHTEPRTDTSRVQGAPKGFVPLRASPKGGVDSHDGARIQLVKTGWAKLDDLVRGQHRVIEENIRMIAGQQHSYFHPALGRWLDVTDWMSSDEQKWRQRPVINRLLAWYIITHARATESQPIITFVPGPDRADAELAEVMDVALKTLWFEMNMEDNHDRLMAWVVAAGRGHLFSRIDPQKGKLRPWVGEDFVPVVDANESPILGPDGEPMTQMVPNVPFGPDGKPRAQWIQYAPGVGELRQTGEPHKTPIGSVITDVLSPLQVRAAWGPEPWHLKRRHYIKSFHTPEEVWEMFSVDVPPNVRGKASDVGEMERVLYGTGFFGGVQSNGIGLQAPHSTEGYVEVTQMWEAPTSFGGMEKTGESAGGRWLVTTPDKVLHDGVRPAAFPHTSPLNTFEFIRMPGRQGGTTPVEALTPLQRAYNANYGQIREHVNLHTNPKAVIDQQSGLDEKDFTNQPGVTYKLARRVGVPAIEYIVPPSLGGDVYKLQQMLREEMNDIGFATGQEVAAGDSGEKLKEMRFDTDRFLGPTMRRAAGEYGRFAENVMAWLPLVWDMETAISYAGDDNIARTITVYPEMFKQGYVNVRPDIESMLPEGRGERQQQTYKMYLDGMFGVPGTPPALRKFWEMARMPHLSRAAKPGGIHSTTAEQENGRMLLGEPAAAINVFEWYDDEAHLAVHEQYMASPEFLKAAPNIQAAFAEHRAAHLFNVEQKMMQAAMAAAAINPAPAPGGAGGGGGGPKPGAKQPDNIGAPSARPPQPSQPTGAALAPPAPLPR